jgi:nitrate reductase gamma subunit
MSTLFSLLFCLAFALFALGLGYRIYDYARTPAPLKIPTTPAPLNTSGVVLRMGREVLFFESLFKGNLWTWGLGMLFHASLLLVVLRHLRYFTEPVCSWIVMIQPFGLYAGLTMLAAVLGLWGRRILVERIRYISTPSDHLMLALFAMIAASGLIMKFVNHTDLIAVKGFALGLMSFNWQPLPEHPVLYVHLFMVALLLLIFPFSKLLHAPGVFFSPTRNQADNPREKRHIAPWAKQTEQATEMGNAK